MLLVSSELDEIMELSDRIAVMYRGKIVDILPRRPGDQRAGGPVDGRRSHRAGRRLPKRRQQAQK